MSIRQLVVSIISPKQKQCIQSVLLNMKRYLRFKSRIQTTLEWTSLGEHNKHSFFGYYDVSPFNAKGEILFLLLGKNLSVADIVLYNRNTRESHTLAQTNAWNWQQGCRLRWLPKSDDCIIFNDYKNGRYLSRMMNIRTHEEKNLNYPLYDIDNSGKYGLSLDFERLGVKRPGYGYTCMPYNEPSDLGGLGIDLVDLGNNTSKRIVTYNTIAHVIGQASRDFRYNYINHLSFSPSGKKFMFFWLTIVGNYHKAYMLVYDFKSETIIPLETEGKVSHYLWLDEEHLLCTVYDATDECRYIIYGLDGSKRHVFKSIDYDGHPIWYKEGLILTDSYPDKDGYQRLMVCNLNTDSAQQIAEIFQEPAISIERRTDLHPRYDMTTDTICIDASPKGKRKLLLITQKK